MERETETEKMGGTEEEEAEGRNRDTYLGGVEDRFGNFLEHTHGERSLLG